MGAPRSQHHALALFPAGASNPQPAAASWNFWRTAGRSQSARAGLQLSPSGRIRKFVGLKLSCCQAPMTVRIRRSALAGPLAPTPGSRRRSANIAPKQCSGVEMRLWRSEKKRNWGGLGLKIARASKAAVFPLARSGDARSLAGAEGSSSVGFAQCPHRKARRNILGPKSPGPFFTRGSGVEMVGLGNFFPVCWCQHWSLDTVPPPPQNLIPKSVRTRLRNTARRLLQHQACFRSLRPSSRLLTPALAAISPTVGPNARIERQGGLFSADRPKLGPAPASPPAHRDHRDHRDQPGRGAFGHLAAPTG